MRSINENGFTLIELIVIMAIIGITSALAAPNILSWLPNMRLKAAARDLYGAAMKSKGEAVKRNTNCALTFNQQIGATTYAYIAFVDADFDYKYDATAESYTDTNSDGKYNMGEPFVDADADGHFDHGDIIFLQVQQWPTSVSLNLTQGGGDGISFTDNDDGNPTVAFKPTAIPTANGGGFVNGAAFLIAKGSSGNIVRSHSVSISPAGNISIN